MSKIMLLGSGELGKEFAISAERMGHSVIAVDNYFGAPAHRVSSNSAVINMLDSDELKECIESWNPDIIVPEIESIRTEVLFEMEDRGIQVVPSARAVNLTMNRDKIRDRAMELGLRVAKFAYAQSLEELKQKIQSLDCSKVVIKPVMSSSGKGQSVVEVKDSNSIELAWQVAISNMRGDRKRVIVEEFINFDSEITLLTIKQKNAPTVFCDPIGHYQERGDYQWSWQPHSSGDKILDKQIISQAQSMAQTITDDLGGSGIFGVEFFICGDQVIFSELSPRPHDTGMVTLISQKLSEFDLHLRAILGLPIHDQDLNCCGGASAVILSKDNFLGEPTYSGIATAMLEPGIDVRIFGKPAAKTNRRMGVVLSHSLDSAKTASGLILVGGSKINK